MTQRPPISVLCVDDNYLVAEALRTRLELSGGFRWAGWLPLADQLVETARETCPDIVLLDIDMPGKDPFAAIEELQTICPEARVIMHSGHVRNDLIDRSVEAGAWGYVSKNEETEDLIAAIKHVAEGQFTLSPEVEATARRGVP